MFRITFLLSLLFSTISCQKETPKPNAKAQWLSDYFSALKTYDDFYAVAYWHEDFDDTHLKINSSAEAQNTFREQISNPNLLSTCSFANQKLIPVPGKKYFGAFPDFCGEEDCVSVNKIQDFEMLVNKNLAWAYFSNNWWDGIVFPQEQVNIIAQTGKTPFIRMMARSEFELYAQDPVWNLIDIVNGVHDTALYNWFTAAKNTQIPLLVEFGTEMNGFWFSWNGLYYGSGTTHQYGNASYPDGPEIFRDAFRHIVDISHQAGAENITWFFHFDVHSDPDEDWNDPVFYYPGDDYIDWLGVSTYGPFSKSENIDDYKPTDLLHKAHEKCTQISTSKPYAILEFGITEM